MKEVIIKDRNNKIISDKNFYEDPTEFLELNKKHKTWGKPERWVRQKFLYVAENGDLLSRYFDEEYDDEDVIEVMNKEENGEIVHLVKLKAQYTIEINDYVNVPRSLSPAQFRLGLLDCNLLDSAESFIENTDNRKLKIYFDKATSFDRDNEMIISLAKNEMGLTDKQIDDVFIAGGAYNGVV